MYIYDADAVGPSEFINFVADFLGDKIIRMRCQVLQQSRPLFGRGIRINIVGQLLATETPGVKDGLKPRPLSRQQRAHGSGIISRGPRTGGIIVFCFGCPGGGVLAGFHQIRTQGLNLARALAAFAAEPQEFRELIG